LVLYEISIVVAGFVERRRAEELEKVLE
jgi:Sec-independent protein secretion pathway component TatC